MVEVPTAELIARSKSGDQVSFGSLVRRYQSYAFALALRVLCNEDDAREVVQDAFVKAWRNLKRYDSSRKFTTWLYAIVANLCLDRLRSVQRRRMLVPLDEAGSDLLASNAEPNPEEVHSNLDLVRIIKHLTGSLPPTQRLVFVLRDLEDLSIEEVSHLTGLSVASVKTNLHIARRKIRGILVNQYNTVGREA